jgi:PRTRC genetic system protein A
MEIISQHISCVVLPGEFNAAIEAGYSEIYAMTSEGIIKHHKLRGQNRFVRLKVDKLPVNYKEEKIGQGINFLPNGKIPIQLFDQVVTFFKQVMEVKKSEVEAMIWVCWDQENGYHLIVPDQRVSKASASYDWASLPAGKTIVCDIHSHNTMGAFFSGTDNRDDQGNIGFSGVVGHLKSETPQTVWRFNYKDKKIECDFDDIFVVPARAEQAVPEDWISKIVTSGGYSGYAGTYTGGSWQGGNSPKGKADHLKPWQYKKGDGSTSEGEGNRAGPHLQDQRRLLPESPTDPYGNRTAGWPYTAEGGFDWENWQFDPSLVHPDDSFDLTRGRPDERLAAAERALASVNEDPSYDESHLGGQDAVRESVHPGLFPYDPRFDPDVDQATGEIRSAESDADSRLAYSGDERFEEIEPVHGKEVAEIFCLIDDTMSSLSGKDELVESLILDMFHMSTEEGQETLFQRLFQELPEKAQERIQMNGIH